MKAHGASLAAELALLLNFMEQLQLQIRVNGEAREYIGVHTVAQLLAHLGHDAVPCAVEVNQQLVPKAKHSQHQLHGGDRVELVTLVGGG